MSNRAGKAERMKDESLFISKRAPLVAWVLVVAWAALIFGLSAVPGTKYPGHPGVLNVIAHFGEYFILGALVVYALGCSRSLSWKIVLLAVAVASLYAASDELHQFFVPGRFCDPMDWLTDTCGALVGALVAVVYLKLRPKAMPRR